MSTYRIRMKWEEDPTRIWRDIKLGAESTLGDLARTFTPDVGLEDTMHMWFFGVDGKYWNSPVKYYCTQSYEDTMEKRNSPVPLTPRDDAEVHNADKMTLEELEPKKGDRLTYLFDYGDGWRFYAIVKEINPEGPFDLTPEVVKRKGGYLNQYIRGPEEPLVYTVEEWEEQKIVAGQFVSEEQATESEPLEFDELIQRALEADSHEEFLSLPKVKGLNLPEKNEYPHKEQFQKYGGGYLESLWLNIPRPHRGLRTPLETKQYSHVGLQKTDFEDAGRNDPCPCGSGSKYKYCCLEEVESGTIHHQPVNNVSFDSDHLARKVLKSLDNEALKRLAQREDIQRTDILVDELYERDLFETIRDLLSSILPPREQYNQPDWYSLSHLFDSILETGGYQQLEQELNHYLKEIESAPYLLYPFLLGINRHLLRNPKTSQPALELEGEIGEFFSNLVQVSFQLKNENYEAAIETVSRASSYWDDQNFVEMAEKQSLAFLKGATFGSRFFHACLATPGPAAFTLASEFEPVDFAREVLTTRSMLVNTIPLPEESPIEVEIAGGNRLKFKQSFTIYRQKLLEQENNSRTFDRLIEKIEQNPADLGLIDALVYLLRIREYPETARDLVNRGVKLGRNALPADYAPEDYQMEWSEQNNRAFMLLLQLKLQLEGHDFEKPEKTLNIARELLKLNPEDNLGVREDVVGFALNLERIDLALEICDRYPDDTSPGILYGRALAFYGKNKEEKAHKALLKAIEQLPRVAKQLINPGNFNAVEEEPRLPGVEPGTAAEGLHYAIHWRPTWEQYGGALNWLKARI